MRSPFVVLVLLMPLAGLAANPAKTMEDQVAAYRAAGEPIEPGDFESKGIPAADNAALELGAAADAMTPDTDPVWKAFDKIPEVTYPVPADQLPVLRALVSADAAAFGHVDAAMNKPAADWGILFTSPVMYTLLPHLNRQRMLAKVINAHALLAHTDGNDAEAIKDMRRLICISRAVDHQPFVVTHLVSLVCIRLGCETLQAIAPDLKIGSAAPAASAEDVQQLIVALLDDGPSTQGAHEALLAERMSLADDTRSVIAGKLNPVDFKLLDPPMPALQGQSAERTQADGLLAIQYATEVRQAFDASSDLPTFKAQLPKRPPELDADRKNHLLGRRLIQSPERWVTTHYRTMADRRLAAVALAIRAYAVAHNGTLPQQLEQLVPQYLPHVPADPMTAGQPLKYIAEKSIVYSVGTDGADDGGSKDVSPATGTDTTSSKQAKPDRWQQRDAVVRLTSSKP